MLSIIQGDLNRIAAAVQAALPHEACGLLVGRHMAENEVRLTRVVPSANLRSADGEAGYDLFEIDPAVRLKLQKELRGTPEAIIGHYHSHPYGVAQPSAIDQQQAYEPELIWLIVAIDIKGNTQFAAFQPQKACGPFMDVPLQIFPDN